MKLLAFDRFLEDLNELAGRQGFDAIRNEQGEDDVEPKRIEMPLKTCRPAK